MPLILAVLFVGCGKGWEMDYGKPAAQFHEQDLLVKGKNFVGKKITAKGVVKKVDTSDPDSAWIILSEGTRCNFGDFRAMAESVKPGDTIYVDGFLKRCEKGEIVIDPAMSRDPKAHFEPK